MSLKRLFVTPFIALFIVIVFLTLSNLAARQVLDVSRAFVEAESLWTKSQKNSVINLYAFISTGDLKQFENYLNAIKTILTFKEARLEIIKDKVDFKKTDSLLVAGGSDPREVRMMAYALHYGKIFYPIQKTIEIWTQGDLGIDKIHQLSLLAYQHQRKLAPSEQKKFLIELEQLNSELSILEIEFSKTIIEVGQWAANQLRLLTFFASLILILAALTHVIRSLRRFKHSVNIIRIGIMRIQKGDTSHRIQTLFNDEIGNFAQVFNKMLDQLEASQKLICEKNRFENLVNVLNQSAIVSMADANGTIEMVNDQFCRISGYSREELIGSNHRIVNSGYHPKEFWFQVWQAISSGISWHGEICNRSKNGTLYWVESNITPTQGEDGKRKYVSIRYDITDQKKTQAQMVQASKMASLGEMAGGIAHEINNPLTIIDGKVGQTIRLLESGKFEPNTLVENLRKVLATTQRISKIIKGLSAFCRNAEGDPYSPAPIQQIVEETISLSAERYINHSVELKLSPIPQMLLECRSTQISQVLLNLLNNAFDAVVNKPSAWVKLEFNQLDSDWVSFSIIDSGSGIPVDIQDRILQPFFTTKEVGKGTGLGLSISKGIIESHGGRFYLNTQSPHTCFVIELPLKQVSSTRKIS